ncbi:hypothetical protein Salat_2118600 [Sesamum alatum]|uniref:Uncharacterized protein n=1 Tax=Sesamum alatum TaxID=300844 RepID=A0AAE1Y0Y6_9LAMI|nr:hypothetical protein Salat_2118600 [Sesamum alatum]
MENEHSTNTAGSATNGSSRWSRRQPVSSSADDILRATYCGTFEWVDPPMCRWSKEFIPRLLNRLNQFELALKRAKERVEEERARGRRYIRIIFVLVLCWAFSFIMNIQYYRKT